MSLNILVDRHHVPNIYRSSTDHFLLNYWNPRTREVIPRELAHQPNLNVITPDELDDVDWFIYPIILNEPFFFIREFMFLDHPYGFWRRVNPEIKKRIDQGKGVVYVAMNSEPVERFDFQALVDSFVESGEKRIVFNIHHSNYEKEGFMSYPGWMEDYEFTTLKLKNFCDERDNSKLIKSPTQKKYLLVNQRYEKHTGSVLITSLLDQSNLLKDGYVHVREPESISEFFQDTKSQLSPNSRLHKINISKMQNVEDLSKIPLVISQVMKYTYFNLVVEAYYSDYMINYPLVTEKIWRNLVYRKPFVCVGQKGTLKQLHQWGYKTFHPWIDEGYDNLDDDDRIFAVFEQVKKLCLMSNTELATMCNDLEHIHDHNIKNFHKRCKDFGTYLRQLKT